MVKNIFLLAISKSKIHKSTFMDGQLYKILIVLYANYYGTSKTIKKLISDRNKK